MINLDINIKTANLVSNQKTIKANKITFTSPGEEVDLNNLNSGALDAVTDIIIKHDNQIITSNNVNFVNQNNNTIRLESNKININHIFGSTTKRIKKIELIAVTSVHIKTVNIPSSITTGELEELGVISLNHEIIIGQQDVTISKSTTESNRKIASMTKGKPKTKTTSAKKTSSKSSTQKLVEQFDKKKKQAGGDGEDAEE